MSKRVEISRVLIRQLYEKERLSTFQIADKLKCCQTTIWKKLKMYNIAPRLPGGERVNLTKEKLEELYLNKNLSTWKIEKKLNISRGTIHRKLKEFNIKTRDRADSHIIFPRRNFSGNKKEKAYLIGFRLGDLGVRKIYPNSKTILVASGSTIKEQINLIKELFEKYGRIWIKETNNKINIQAHLNESFNFLLPKDCPVWVFNNKSTFFSFLAGFSDAEGNMGVYNKMARFSLGNYNKKLLFNIYKALNKHNIKCNKPFSDKRKGKRNSEGYRYHENYWHLRVCNKNDLADLLIQISPYIKHQKKIKALNMCIENIKSRNKIENIRKK